MQGSRPWRNPSVKVSSPFSRPWIVPRRHTPHSASAFSTAPITQSTTSELSSISTLFSNPQLKRLTRSEVSQVVLVKASLAQSRMHSEVESQSVPSSHPGARQSSTQVTHSGEDWANSETAVAAMSTRERCKPISVMGMEGGWLVC